MSEPVRNGTYYAFIIDLRRTNLTIEDLQTRLLSRPIDGLDEVIALTKEGKFARVWPITK